MTTLQQYAKNFLEAVTGGHIKEAQAAIAGGQKLLLEVELRWTGDITSGTGRRRGRPARTAATAATATAPPAKVKPNVPGILTARGPLTREQIIQATGWKAQAANVQLARLVKEGTIVLDGERYRANITRAAAPEEQQTAAA